MVIISNNEIMLMADGITMDISLTIEQDHLAGTQRFYIHKIVANGLDMSDDDAALEKAYNVVYKHYMAALSSVEEGMVAMHAAKH